MGGSSYTATYTYERGDGNDTLRDTSAKTDASGQPAPNTLQFAAGITADELVLGREPGVLKIALAGGQGEVLRIEGFDPEDALGQHPIDRYEFADGTVLTHAQLLARGFDLVGGASNDSLTGTSVDDRIDGGAGNDRMPARNDAEWRAAA